MKLYGYDLQNLIDYVNDYMTRHRAGMTEEEKRYFESVVRFIRDVIYNYPEEQSEKEQLRDECATYEKKLLAVKTIFRGVATLLGE